MEDVAADAMCAADDKQNPLARFGCLYLPYLSGDDWMGAEPAACVPWGEEQSCSGVDDVQIMPSNRSSTMRPLWFAGTTNFLTAVKHWRASLDAPLRRVLISGGSAGGQGAYVQADRLAALLGADVEVKADPQYGWFAPPTDAYADWVSGRHTDPSVPYPSPASLWPVPNWMYNITLALPAACLASLPQGTSHLACTSTPVIALTVGVPLFVSNNVFDDYVVSVMEGVPGGKLGPTAHEDPKLAYLLEVTGPAMKGTMANATSELPSSLQRAKRGAFVPACVQHGMAWAGESAPRVGNCTHAEAVASWFFGSGECKRFLIDERTHPTELSKLPCNAGKFKTV